MVKECFVLKAIECHGEKYDYSRVNYINAKSKVCIVCPKHGEFWQLPRKHLNGQGCPTCGGSKKLTFDTFVKKAKEIHHNKYDIHLRFNMKYSVL